jgi:hypothetical protein
VVHFADDMIVGRIDNLQWPTHFGTTSLIFSAMGSSSPPLSSSRGQSSVCFGDGVVAPFHHCAVDLGGF